MITFVAAVLLQTFSEDVLTALVPSELRITVYEDLMSSDTNYELSVVFFYFVDFSQKVTCIYDICLMYVYNSR